MGADHEPLFRAAERDLQQLGRKVPHLLLAPKFCHPQTHQVIIYHTDSYLPLGCFYINQLLESQLRFRFHSEY